MRDKGDSPRTLWLATGTSTWCRPKVVFDRGTARSPPRFTRTRTDVSVPGPTNRPHKGSITRGKSSRFSANDPKCAQGEGRAHVYATQA
ncbi:hypothetical protein DPMN_169759 [Dreissena polymorpha]|uniref:Uncharacterized protein n=1 Tax=Dreissena polymorpha TaxID=45954 RepID=A0A9D4ICJ7_DREPO|nr:hypothetical protein DPMN_169759 [Dreissena polymorpha]